MRGFRCFAHRIHGKCADRLLNILQSLRAEIAERQRQDFPHLIVRDAPEVGGSGVLVASSRNVRIEDDVLRNNRSYGVRTWNSSHVRM